MSSRPISAGTGRNALVVVVVAVLAAQAIATTRAAAADAPTGVVPGFELVDLGRLAEIADELRATVRDQPAADGAATVRARVRTAGASGPGCGFAFLANDDARLSSHVPRFERASCAVRGADGPRVDQRVQFARPAAEYEAAVTVPAAAGVDNVTFTSNGGDGVAVETLCLGFGGGGDAQAFCVDRHLLDACARAVGYAFRPDDVWLGDDAGIRLSRAFRGRVAPSCKEIVFRDVGGLARGFKSLVRGDGGAPSEVCSRIGLVAETSAWAYDAAKCYAQRGDAATGGGFYYVKTDRDHLLRDCARATDGEGDAAATKTTAKTSG